MAKTKLTDETGEKEPVKERPHYEEWYVRIKSGQVEKMKMKRPRVLISDEQAAILNEGTVNGFSTEPTMYYQPGAEEPMLPSKN